MHRCKNREYVGTWPGKHARGDRAGRSRSDPGDRPGIDHCNRKAVLPLEKYQGALVRLIRAGFLAVENTDQFGAERSMTDGAGHNPKSPEPAGMTDRKGWSTSPRADAFIARSTASMQTPIGRKVMTSSSHMIFTEGPPSGVRREQNGRYCHPTAPQPRCLQTPT